MDHILGVDSSIVPDSEWFRPHHKMTNPTKIFTDLPPNLPDELCTTLLDDANVRIERIVCHGHASPEGLWNDQDQHERVVVLNGAARLRFEDELSQ
jgi:hypothetical protein